MFYIMIISRSWLDIDSILARSWLDNGSFLVRFAKCTLQKQGKGTKFILHAQACEGAGVNFRHLPSICPHITQKPPSLD